MLTQGKLEYVRLKKSKADYQQNAKEIQKRIAARLFNASNKNRTSANNNTINDEVPVANETTLSQQNHQENKSAATDEIHSNNNTPNNANKVITDNATTTTTSTKLKPTEPNTNLIFLIGTSFAVVILSVIAAYMLSTSSPS
jgi:ABC-type Na+ efflux pump permease subunit